MIDRADTKPLTVSVRASNKKTANSTCALQMVRLLFKEGLIERYGERAGSAPKAWCNLTQQQQQQPNQQHTDEEPTQMIGTKRKADDEVRFDENGNWTLETAKNRLSKLYQAKGLDFNAPLQCSEVGFPPNKQYQVIDHYSKCTVLNDPSVSILDRARRCHILDMCTSRKQENGAKEGVSRRCHSTLPSKSHSRQ